MGIHFIQENEYPKRLKEIGKDAPKHLYYKGTWDDEIFENCLAVVGSRLMTTYGRQVTEKIVGEAAMAGITIVSGFMYGVDAEAHKAALNVGGRTIAVMPCGIDLINPEYQQDLYMKILNHQGLIISEYEGAMAPALWTYPRRNRIVAGLSQAVLIIEAGEKSGSLITANLAKKFKRKLFVVPGPITSENSKGISQLLKEGAEAVSSAQDILGYYKIMFENPKSKFQMSNNATEQEIIAQLQREGLNTDNLSRILNKSAAELGVILSTMELKGIIKQAGNKYYVS